MKNKNKFLGKTVILTKAVDEVFGGNHPKGINEGDVFEGRLTQFDLKCSAIVEIDERRIFRTSSVIFIDEDSGVFQTQNSLYKIELHPNQIDYNQGEEKEMLKGFTEEVNEQVEREAPDVYDAPHYGGEAENGQDMGNNMGPG